MYLLNKVFQLRDHVNPDHEKPFLDHLEDLRVMVFKVVITLLVSMGFCFIFQQQLMDVLRRPIDEVMVMKAESQLDHSPTNVTVEQWEKAKQADHAAAALLPEEREAFFETINDPDLQFHIRVAALVRAAMVLPVEQRDAFLEKAAPEPASREQVKFLIEKKASPDAASIAETRMMSSLKPTETFMLSMKLAFFAGIVLAFPLLLMFILQFILPGLHNNERKVLWPALAIGFGLFLTGGAFAYFVVLPRALEFFYSYSETLGVSNEWRIGEYISFATMFTLLFGLSFELPVVVMVIVKLGLLSYSTMKTTRRYAIVGVVVLAAVLTPTPDVLTLSLMAIPMYLLYEVCIWLAYFSEKKEKQKEDDEARERMERLLRDHEEVKPDVPKPVYPVDSEDVVEISDDGWDEVPPHDPDDPHAAVTDFANNLPKSDELDYEDESPTAPPPDSIPEEEERRRTDR